MPSGEGGNHPIWEAFAILALNSIGGTFSLGALDHAKYVPSRDTCVKM
jgi:hypothetical protein